MEHLIAKIREYGGIIYEPKQRGSGFVYTFDISPMKKKHKLEIEQLLKEYNGK